jgi:hypothetical protein
MKQYEDVDLLVKEQIYPLYPENGPMSEAEIAETEVVIGRRLPERLRNILLQFGECLFNEETTIVVGNGNRVDITSICGCNRKFNENLIIDQWNEGNLKDFGLVCFAAGLGGEVYSFHKETEIVYGSDGLLDVSWEECVFVADSIDDFFRRIEFYTDAEMKAILADIREKSRNAGENSGGGW